MSQRALVSTAILVWIVIVCFILLFHDKAPVNDVKATTERVQVRVVNPSTAAFSIAGYRMFDDSPFAAVAEGACGEGVFTPSPGAVIEYVRIGDGPLRISVRPAGPGQRAGGTGTGDGLPAGAVHFIAADACGGLRARRLPVWGAVALGDDLRGTAGTDTASALLLEGEISVSARSVTLFGLLPPTLYHVTTVRLPTGSRVSEVGADEAPDGALWAGYVSLAEAGRGLEFRAVTDARNLKLFLPGQGGVGDQLRIGLLIPVFQDPYLVFLQILLGSVLVASQALATLVDFFGARRPDVKERNTE